MCFEAPLKRRHDRVPEVAVAFPRMEVRGPIEARLRWHSWASSSRFRGWKSAAPLKRVDVVLFAKVLRRFRGWKSAAPLKLMRRAGWVGVGSVSADGSPRPH